MNEYLAKLHCLELGPKGQDAKKRIVEAPTKPDKTSSVSFVGAHSMGFSWGESRASETDATSDMQNVISWGREKHSHGDRQNRQNLVAASFPFVGALDQLDRECPEYVATERWRQCLIDAQRFLAAWGDKAAALGWAEADLFGLHTPPAKPHPSYSRLSRYDALGLLWLLQGRRVVALSATIAAIESTSGAVLTYRKPPLD